MMLCRIYRDNRKSIVLRKVDGLTEAQGVALERLIERWNEAPAGIEIGMVGEPQLIMTNWGNIWIGIETDGYAHS